MSWHRSKRAGSRLLRSVVGALQLAAIAVRRVEPVRISFVTCVKDRCDHLVRTLTENIENHAQNPDCEFVLLDYSCPDPRTKAFAQTELQRYIDVGRLSYYYHPHAALFSQAHSRNLGFRLSRGEIICNVDADNYLGRGFDKYVAAMLSDGKSFLRGPQDGRGLSGRICVRRTHFNRVGGYDERMVGWGSEDVDLSNRLEMLGLTKRVILPERFCRSIPHSHTLRHQYQADPDTDTSARKNRIIMRENLRTGTLCPNGSSFGLGTVQANFGGWVECVEHDASAV